jgi:hypothetical protein
MGLRVLVGCVFLTKYIIFMAPWPAAGGRAEACSFTYINVR